MILALLLFWFILSGQVALFFLISAIVSVILIAIVDKKLFISQSLIIGIKLSWIIFISQLLKEIFLSSIYITKIIWLKPKSITPCYEWIQCSSKESLTQVIYANSITLTPGTMSMDIKDGKILVHAISFEAMDDLRQATLEKQVLKLEKI
jgi:multicomponent Na+:H+ antiporter subunit E